MRATPQFSEACLIIDVQARYFNPHCDSFGRIKDVLPDLRDRMPVVWVYMDSVHFDMNAPQRAEHDTYSQIFNRLATKSPFIFDNPPVLEPSSYDWVMTKQHCSAFSDGNLADFLREKSLKNIYIAGYIDSVCVLQTGAEGNSQGFKTRVLRDLTGETPDGASSETLKTYKKRGIRHMTSKELLLSPVR